jgi:RHS repeat-associated protein
VRFLRLSSNLLFLLFCWQWNGYLANGQTFDQCIYVLNGTAADSLSVVNTAKIQAPNCGILVNSTNAAAMRVTGTGSVVGKYIRVRGGVSQTPATTTITPAPSTGAQAITDPLSSLAAPNVGDCTATNYTTAVNATLNPGVYCGGITITGTANVNFTPGLYILLGGGLSVPSGTGTVSGAGVTFYLTANATRPYGPLNVGGTKLLNLSAPTSGTYRGILFYQDRTLTGTLPASSLSGTVQSTLSGVLYFSRSMFSLAGTSLATQPGNLILIADRVTLSGTSELNAKTDSAPPWMPATAVGLSPTSVSRSAGQTQQFTASVTNASSTAVTWSLAPSVGSLSANGLYTAPPVINSAQTVTVTATSVADPTKSASAAISLQVSTTVPNISLTPSSQNRYATQTQQFTALVGGQATSNVVWTLSPVMGTLSNSGLYTAPVVVPVQTTTTIKATSTIDPSKSASALVTLFPITMSISPSSQNLNACQTQGFSAQVNNNPNTAVTWSISPAVGSINASGVYTAPSSIASQQTVTIRATSVADSTKFVSSPVTLFVSTSSCGNVSLSISPSTATRSAAQTQQFTASVSGTTNQAVTWSLSPATGAGTINSTGLYTAPATVTASTTVTVTATSQADSTKTASATVLLAPSIAIDITPSTVSLNQGGTQQFTATVTGTINQGVTWTLYPATGAGMISATGLYTAPATVTTQTTVTVTATSQADPTKAKTATITLTPPVVISITPNPKTLIAGASFQFAVTGGGASPAVIWSVVSPNAGNISPGGLYTAPNCIATNRDIQIKATLSTDASVVATAVITLSVGTDFASRRVITVEKAKAPASDLVDFPLAVAFTDASLRSKTEGGKVEHPQGFDIRFAADAACTNPLAYELERWNGTTGSLLAWVKLPLFRKEVETRIFLCYGNATITTAPAAVGTWNENFSGVWHMGTIGSLLPKDSTSNNRPLVLSGTTNTADGKIDGSLLLSGNLSYADLPTDAFNFASSDSPNPPPFQQTFEAWFKTSVPGGLLGQTNGSTPPNGTFSYVPAIYLDSNLFLRSSMFWHSAVSTTKSNMSFRDGNWHQVTVTNDGQNEKLYADGVLVAEAAVLARPSSPNYRYFLGAADGGNAWPGISGWSYLNGSLDEVRISSSVRSSDWIATSFANQTNPATFVTVSDENPLFVLSPATPQLYAGQTLSLSALPLSCIDQNVLWSVNPVIGTISQTGVYTAPTPINSVQTVTISASSSSQPTASASSLLTLSPPIVVNGVSPSSVTLSLGQQQQFTAQVTNTRAEDIDWSVNPAIGWVNGQGLYQAPASLSADVTVRVIGTSKLDRTKSSFALVKITPFAASPQISPEGGSYSNPRQVSILTSTPETTIRYTTDGSSPTATAGLVYSGPFVVSSSVTVKAIAFGPNAAPSDVSSVTYSILNATSSAQFEYLDFSTRGNWPDFYGQDGYSIVGGTAQNSSYASVTQNGGVEVIAPLTTDEVAPVISRTSPLRILAKQGSFNGVSTDVVVSDTARHQLAMYFYGTADLTVILQDLATGARHDLRVIKRAELEKGVYSVWNFSGSIRVQLFSGFNRSDYAGIFLDPPRVKVFPSTMSLSANETLSFTALTAASPNQSYTWSISPNIGNISASGVYRAPAVIFTPDTVTIRATNSVGALGVAKVHLIPGTSGGAFDSAFNLISESLCRRPAEPPTISAKAQNPTPEKPCPTCSVTTKLSGEVRNFVLRPGASLSYNWSVVSGPGVVSFTNRDQLITDVVFNSGGLYLVQLAVSDGINVATITIEMTVTEASVMLLTPAIIGPISNGQRVTFTASSFAFFRNNVRFTVTGANPQSVVVQKDRTTNRAVFSYVGTNPGTDTVQAFVLNDSGNPESSSNLATVNWAGTNPTLTTSTVTGRFFKSNGTGSFQTLATEQPLFVRQFPTLYFNPAAPAVSGVTDESRPMLGVLTDTSGSPIGTIPASGNGHAAGRGELFQMAAVFTGTLQIPTAGQVTLAITSDDGFQLGIGGTASRVSGPLVNGATVTPFSNLPVLAAFNQRTAPESRNVVINFPSAGSYPYELNYAKGGDSRLTLTVLTAGKPIAPAVQLKLTPGSLPPATAGQVRIFSLEAHTAEGTILPDHPVAIHVSGPNAEVRNLRTDGTGKLQFAYAASSYRYGIDSIQAIARVGAQEVVSNVVTQQWNNGINQGPLVSAGNNQSIQMPSAINLDASISDDGLPSTNLTATWSKVSGPGTVQFQNANSAATSATFSLPGTYGLRLSVTDGVFTTTDDVTIVAIPEPFTPGGWIGQPSNGATVTGTVSFSVIAGVTLNSGTLSYYPVGNPSAATILNPSTTGSGTLGTLDTTTLPNGSYIVRLSSTNSTGQNLVSEISIVVDGEYKPGRIQTSMVDMTVPLAGLPVRIERQYDSLNRNVVGDFGFGWRLGVYNLDFRVDPRTNNVTMTVNGSRKTFRFTPTGSLFGYWLAGYTAANGLYGSLSSTDNCGGLLLRVGNGWQCGIGSAGDVTLRTTSWTYTDPSGRVYQWDGNSNLTSLKDQNGVTLNFTVNGITSSAGNLLVPFQRDLQGRVTKITDPKGKDYLYAYNAQGELTSVTYPSITTPATFTYDPGHYLKDYRDPRGNIANSQTYFPDGRLRASTDAAGNTTQYAYSASPSSRITTITHPDGGIEEIEQDAQGNTIRRKDALNRQTTYTFDASNNMLTETNPAGEIKTYTYDARGFRTSVKDALNRITSTAYNTYGGPTQITDPTGFVQNVSYDAAFNPQQLNDGLGSVAEMTWNNQGLPLTMKDARGNTSTYAYDVYGNRTSYTDALSRTTAATFNSYGQKLTETNPRGHVSTWVYDDLGRNTSMMEPLGKTTTYEYDANGNKTAQIDSLGRRTEFTYDAKNRLIQTKYPDNTTMEMTYDFRDNKLTEKDELGRTTKYEYDLAGQLRKVTKAFGTTDASVEEHTYDSAGRKKTDKDARGNVTTYNYDVAGQMTSMVNANGKTWTYEYDGRSRRTKMTDPRGRITRYDYDGRGRQTKMTYPDNKFVTQTFDPMGLILTRTDQEFKLTSWAYDAASQLIRVIDGLGNITEYGFDASGNKVSQKDARNNTTTYEYDALQRRTKRCLPLLMCETMTYDLEGNLLTRTDFNGRTTTMTYDSRNRNLTTQAAANFIGEVGITRTYTSTGKAATMVDASGSTSWSYDNQDRVLTKATPQGTLSYSYHPNSLVASVNSSNANGVSVNYNYDVVNRLSGVVDNRINGTTTYAYDDSNNLATVAYPNGVNHTYTVDVKDHVTGVQITKAPAILANFGYVRAGTGNITNVNETGGRAVSFSYDNAWRLTNETISGDPTAANNGSLSYALDAVANRTALSSTLAAIAAQTNGFDANDRVQADTSDANGNTLSSSGKNYSYDFLDRLQTATGPGGNAVTLAYDGNGQRVAKTIGGVTTRYLIDDLTPTGYAQVAEELVAGAVTKRYVYGPMRISMATPTTTSFYLYDGGGSVRGLADSAGVVTDTWSYDAFGNTVARTGTTANDMLYRGEQFDADLGFYYLRARWYDPVKGRFLSADKYEGDDRMLCCHVARLQRSDDDDFAHHSYSYAYHDPIGYWDPSGYARLVQGQIGRHSQLQTFESAGLQRHHIIQRRFGCIFGVLSGTMLSIAVTPAQHKVLDAVWRTEIPYGNSCETKVAKIKDVLHRLHGDDPAMMIKVAEWVKEMGIAGLL